jgi:dephospho-CoA kinase
MGLDRLCDAIILVTAPLCRRLQRARHRDNHSIPHILRRLWSQRGLNTQAYRSPADTITVENGRSLEALHQRLGKLPLFRNR